MIRNDCRGRHGLLLAFALMLAACTPQQRPAPEPTPPLISPPAVSPAPTPSTTVRAGVPTATSRRPKAVPTGKTYQAGQFCSLLGATGYTPTGRKLVCDHSHSENYLRWRYAQ